MKNLVFTLSACTTPAVLKVISFVNQILDIIFFIVPIGLIIMASIDLVKNVISTEDEMKKNQNLVMKRFIYAVALFLVPTIVDFTIDLVDDAIGNVKSDYESCIKNTENIAYYEKLEAAKKEKEEQEEEQYYQELAANSIFKQAINAYTVSNKTETTTGSGISVIGQTYNFSEAEIKDFASVSYREQGSAIGAAAEASLILNVYELSNSNKSNASYDDIKNSKACSYFFTGTNGSKRPDTTQEIVDAVSAVVKLGKRTLPLYINEHDCWDCNKKNYCSDGKKGDICKITVNEVDKTDLSSIKNRNNYKQDETKIYNVYGNQTTAYYTFYIFPTENSDPFGYTASAKEKIQSRDT